MTLSIHNTALMTLSITELYHYGGCHNGECHNAERHNAECHCVECHYAECRVLFVIMLIVIMLNVISPFLHYAEFKVQKNPVF